MSVQRSKRSAETQAVGCLPLSAPDVAVPSATSPGETSCGASQTELLIVLSSILHGLQNVVLSPDQWWLAIHSARRDAKKAGLDAKTFDQIAARVEAARIEKVRFNPMARAF